MSLFEASLRECTDDMCDAAARADDRPIVGREAEARQVAELLAARRSMLLVGDAGAGKSAVMQRVVAEAVGRRTSGRPGALRIFRTSTSRLISETKYLGEWQSKLTSIVRELEDYGHAVLYMTDIWNLTSVGRSESTDETMADLFKEFVESNRIVLVGEATKVQIAAYFDRMPSFRNLLVQVRVDPCPGELVRPILSRVAESVGARMNVAFDDVALERIIDLTNRFLPYRHQPGKAIELFERALHRSVQESASDEPVSIDATVVEQAFAESTGLPMFVISDRERVTTDAIRQFFAERVPGQEHALDRIVFRSLTRETVRRIALRELGRVYGRRGIANRGVAIEVDDRLLDRVLDRGFNPKYGARALKREISSEVVVPLAIAMMETAVEPSQILRLEPRGDRGTTVRVIETDESPRASAVDEEISIEGRRLSLSEIGDCTRALAIRLTRVAAEHDFDTLERRIEAIRERQATEGYWTDQTSALADFSEYNKLVGKVRLVRELEARLGEIETRSRDAVRRKDVSVRELLARDFVRAELACDRLEVELTTFDESDDAPALVTLRVQGATSADLEWLDVLTGQYVAWARTVGRPFEVLSERAIDGSSAEPVGVIRVDGPFAFGYLKGEAGIHRMRDVQALEGGKRAISAVARVEVWPLNADADAAVPVEWIGAVRVRARGSRLARLRSCVVARSGERVLHLQNGRTVDENRVLAAETFLMAGPAVGHDATQAVRAYHVSGRRKIRDPRTGLAVSGRAVDTYLAGGVDTFQRRNAVALKQLELE